MLNQIANIIFMTLAGTAQGLALEYMLEVNNRKTSKNFRVLYWTILALIPSILNVMIDSGTSTVFARNAIHWGMAIAAIFWFYLGPMWRRIVAVVLMYFGMTTADLVLLVAMQFTEVDWAVFWNKKSTIAVVFVGIGMSISIVSIAIIAFVWRKVFYKGKDIKYFGFFMLYILNYMVTYVFMEFQIWQYDVTKVELWPVLTSIICEIALLAIIFSQAEKEELAKHLVEEKQRAELEKIQYQEIAQRRAEIKTISRENAQEANKIKEHLTKENISQAELELRNFLKRVELTKEYPYCGIPIINAILSEKQKQCAINNINLDIDLNIPDELNIQQIDLCSIFGNLLDNAIRASIQIASHCGYNGAEISLSAAARENYFIIKCENPAMKAPGKIPEGSGYGLKILKDIAGKYQGDFQTQYENHKFKAQISVRI